MTGHKFRKGCYVVKKILLAVTAAVIFSVVAHPAFAAPEVKRGDYFITVLTGPSRGI